MTDFVCMGIDSPLAFKKYIESLEKQYNSKVVYFKAKSKEVGWRYLTNKAVFENGKSYFGINGRDANLNATFLDVLVRPSCYDCKFKGFPRVSDMTIGDYWRRRYDYDPLDDNTGTSYVMLHNEKATNLFRQIEGKCLCREVSFEEIVSANRYALQSLPKPSFSRKEFYLRLQQEDFAELVNDYSKTKQKRASNIGKVKKIVVPMLKALYYYKCSPMSFIRFIHYNVFSSQVKTNIVEGDILVLRNVNLKLEKGAILYVKGICMIGAKGSHTDVHLGKDATLSLDNNDIKSGISIVVEDGASIVMGHKTIVDRLSSFYTRSNISIGEFSVVGEDVCMDDTNKGIVYFSEINKKDRNITIGTHVLLNKGSVIKGGTTLNDETIVKEYAVVDGSFAPRTVLAGNPATVIDKNIIWKHNFENIWNFKN